MPPIKNLGLLTKKTLKRTNFKNSLQCIIGCHWFLPLKIPSHVSWRVAQPFGRISGPSGTTATCWNRRSRWGRSASKNTEPVASNRNPEKRRGKTITKKQYKTIRVRFFLVKFFVSFHSFKSLQGTTKNFNLILLYL